MRKKTTKADRRKQIRENQLTIFGWMVSVMGLMVVLSLLVLAGFLPTFLPKDFSQPYDQTKLPIGCPPANSKTVALKDTNLEVYNSTFRTGLAKKVADIFKKAGYKVNKVTNSEIHYPETARIFVHPNNLLAGYSIAALVPQSKVYKDDTMAKNTVQVVLGADFNFMATEKDLKDALKGGKPIALPSICDPHGSSKPTPSDAPQDAPSQAPSTAPKS